MPDAHRLAAETARDLVRSAATLALEFAGKVAGREKEDGSGPVTEADLAVQAQIVAGLQAAFPEDEILGEESTEQVDLAAARLWCVDPLDGTKEFIEGRHDYASMIGLLHNGEPVAGAFALPACGLLFWGWRDGGAFVEEHGETRALALDVSEDPSAAIVVHTRSHPSEALERALQRIGPKQTVAAGSVGYKVGQILLGKAQIYVHPGPGTKWWDSVGPGGVLLGLGGALADAGGDPLIYRDSVHHGRGLLFTAPGLHAPVVDLLRA
ncbi:MAG: 3'(2'),5'-bisphosphate nucleotidase CysQ [Planctomycetota bacterium]|nr:3'(2'),5'-bisphosphate nucleotidase CysQ [Planctomycetota bacterium]